jgi:pimeloyl-ACP methyl ester carboxylesterase
VLFELLEDVGHWTQQEAPTAVNALLLKFLESVGAK